MIRCRSCRRGVRRLLATEKARAVARREESFVFACPHCGEVHQVSIDDAGELALILEENGGLRTPNFFDVLFSDPEIRKALWGDEDGDPED
jgi:hypothetical protein